MAEATIFVQEATYQLPIQKIEHLLGELNGVERVLIDPDDGEIKVEYDDTKVKQSHLIIALEEKGFHLQ